MAMASQSDHQLHVILFPLMAPGHMIPMVDIAKLLAQRRVAVSIVTTPRNALRFRSTISRAGDHIRTLEIPFPAKEAGLPEGCENLDSLPSFNLLPNFFVALDLLRNKVEEIICQLNPPPNCLISDMGLPWTTEIAEKLQIPRIVFHGTCCFSLVCSHIIVSSQILDTLECDSDNFLVPNIPDKIRLRKSQVFGSSDRKSPVLKEVTDKIRSAERTSYGVIVNTFNDLEPDYVKEYSKIKGEKIWCIGPVSLCNQNDSDLSERGNKSTITSKDALNWLDSHRPKSVIYASLGSLARVTSEQMMEIGIGLELTNRPFIWVLGGGLTEALEKMITENGFEERVKDRGLLIRGWAPQALILTHNSVGGFLTHCGWNSTLEGITAGVPMATWPFFADQFFNQKVVVQLLGIGVSLGVETPVKWGEEEKVGVLVKRDQMKEALELLMDEGEEGEQRRLKASKLGEMAKLAVGEGGSSYFNLTSLIDEIRAKAQ